jgi:hypothetical protein
METETAGPSRGKGAEGAEGGPRLYPIRPTGTPKAFVIHCGDPRFQEPIARFLREELGLQPGDCLPLVVGGGVASLLVADALPKEAKFIREAIAFYLGLFPSIQRLVLINHEDCGKYRALARALPLFLHRFGGLMTERQLADLKQAGEQLAARHRMAVASYFAAFANPEHTLVRFTPIRGEERALGDESQR